MVQKDASVEFLSEACDPIKETPICAEFISEVLHFASIRLVNYKIKILFFFLFKIMIFKILFKI